MEEQEKSRKLLPPPPKSPSAEAQILDTRALLDAPVLPPVPLIEGVILDSPSITMIHGAPSSGKTYVAIEAAVALTTGSAFLGTYSTGGVPRKVMFVEVDQSMKSLVRRFQMRLLRPEAEGYKPLVRENLILVGDGVVALDRHDFAQSLVHKILVAEPHVVIIDTLSQSVEGDVLDASTAIAVHKFLKTLQGLCGEYGRPIPNIIFTHHDKKVSADKDANVTPRETFLGSIMWQSMVDFQIGVKKHPKPVTDRLDMHLHKDRHGLEEGKKIQCLYLNEQDDEGKITSYLLKADSTGISQKAMALIEELTELTEHTPDKGVNRARMKDYAKNMNFPNFPHKQNDLTNAIEEAFNAGRIACSHEIHAQNPHKVFWSLPPNAQ